MDTERFAYDINKRFLQIINYKLHSKRCRGMIKDVEA